MKKPQNAAITLAVALVLPLAACGADDDNPAPAQPSQTATENPSEDATAPEDDAADEDATDEAGDDADADAESDGADRKSTRLNSSHVAISYAVFCLKKKNDKLHNNV